MGDRMRHRGPDGEGSHLDGPCGIAVRCLSSMDMPGQRQPQPLSNADGTLSLVCNGEIFNLHELRSALQELGCDCATASDGEVLLSLYEADGDDFVRRLNGTFAFALWDARRRRLLIGRDRLGVKPLYVLQDWQRLAFASEAKALLVLPGVAAELDRTVVADYLHLGYVAAPACFFKGMRKLPPATLLAVEDGRIREWRYWRLPAHPVPGLSETEWVERIRTCLADAVRRQAVSDAPVGVFLSGGVASSGLAGLMASHSGQTISSYTVGCGSGEGPAASHSLGHARRVAERFSTRHREILLRPDVVALLPKLLWHLDEPLSGTDFIAAFMISDCARQDVKVALSGIGGNALFGGYRRCLSGYYLGRYGRLPEWLRRCAHFVARRLPTSHQPGPLDTLRLAAESFAALDKTADERYRSALQVLDRQAVAALLLEPSIAASDPLTRAFAVAGREDELNRMLAVDVETLLPDHLLLLADKMSMAVSLECRLPLLDHQLVELAATLPASIKVRNGRPRRVLEASLAGLLPAGRLDQRSAATAFPEGAWLREPLAPLPGRLLATEVVNARGLFRPSAIADLVAAHEAKQAGVTDLLVALINLEIWSRVFLDRRDPTDVADELKAYVAPTASA